MSSRSEAVRHGPHIVSASPTPQHMRGALQLAARGQRADLCDAVEGLPGQPAGLLGLAGVGVGASEPGPAMIDPSASAERPTAYLLVGLPGSGKSTYARRLEDQGVIRLSVDEVLACRYGRYGIDYPHPRHGELQAPIRTELTERMVELLGAGRSVVFDHGLWLRADRDVYKRLVEDAGGRWRLLYFAAAKEVLIARLSRRNTEAGEDAEVLNISPGALEDFYRRFDEPAGEGEEILPQS